MKALTGANSSDILTTATNHGYHAGERVVFRHLAGGSGVDSKKVYFVIADNLGARTFQVSETKGGEALNLGSDITSGFAVRYFTGGKRFARSG